MRKKEPPYKFRPVPSVAPVDCMVYFPYRLAQSGMIHWKMRTSTEIHESSKKRMQLVDADEYPYKWVRQRNSVEPRLP